MEKHPDSRLGGSGCRLRFRCMRGGWVGGSLVDGATEVDNNAEHISYIVSGWETSQVFRSEHVPRSKRVDCSIMPPETCFGFLLTRSGAQKL